MKKTTLILLVLIYSLSTFGVSLKEFYCCGKLKSVSVFVVDNTKEKCAKGDEKDGCCKTKYQFFKIKDKHFVSGHTTIPPTSQTDLHLSPSFNTLVLFTPQSLDVINGSHAPPLHIGVPLYISNCVFRI